MAAKKKTEAAKPSPSLRRPMGLAACGVAVGLGLAMAISTLGWVPDRRMPAATGSAAGEVIDTGWALTGEGAIVWLECVWRLDGKEQRLRLTESVAVEAIPEPSRFAAGTAVTVSYVPSNPAQALVREFPGRPWPWKQPQFLAGIGMFIAGALVLLYRMRNPDRDPSAAA